MGAADDYSVDAARRAGDRGELDKWVAGLLCSPGSDNEVLATQLTQERRHWLGPVLLPIERLHRLAGPAGHPVLQPVDEDEWRDDVEEIAELGERTEDLPPVVVTYRDGSLLLEDGNHRVEGLRRGGAREVWAVVAFDNADDRDRFAQSCGARGSGRG